MFLPASGSLHVLSCGLDINVFLPASGSLHVLS